MTEKVLDMVPDRVVVGVVVFLHKPKLHVILVLLHIMYILSHNACGSLAEEIVLAA